MKQFLDALSTYFEAIPDKVGKKRILMWLFFLSATVLAGYGVKHAKFDMAIEGWLADDNPVKAAFNHYKAEFGSDDVVFIVYEPKDGDLFSPETLKAVKGIREDLLDYKSGLREDQDSKLKHITKITTLVNAPVLEVKEDLLISRQLVGDTIPSSKEAIDAVRHTAETQRKFPLLFYSKDMRYGGIVIETNFGAIPIDADASDFRSGGDMAGFEEGLVMDDMSPSVEIVDDEKPVAFKSTDIGEYVGLMEAINAVLEKPEYAGRLSYFPVGTAPWMEYNMKIMEEMGPLYLAMLGIMMILLWYLFRSLSAVLWPISIIVLTAIWTVGIAGWLGMTMTGFLILTIMLILSVGAADAVHILSGYIYFRGDQHDHRAALRMAFKKAAPACLLTSATTIIAMLTLAFTPIAHIAVFGYMSAIGVSLALIFTLYWLPMMLDIWSPVKKKEVKRKPKRRGLSRYIPDFANKLQSLLERIPPLVQKSPLSVVTVFLVVFGICVYGSTNVKVDTNLIEQFKKGAGIRKTYELVDRNMMGTQNMEIFLDLGAENAFQDPFVLRAMDDLQKQMVEKYSRLVVRTSSLADVVKDAYQKLNEGRQSMYVIPTDRNVLSQTLFLFDNASPADRRKLVSDDYSKSHISLQLYNAGSHDYLKTFDMMRKDIDAAAAELKTRYAGVKVSITGGLALMMTATNYVSLSSLKSFGWAIAVITIVLLIIFGSFKAGMISIFPNLIPATLTFGLLGLLDIGLDFDMMVMAPVIIGIAVDDTIHFISHYRDAVRDHGNIQRALLETMKEVGQAITFTTMILGLGFSIMILSSSAGTSNMGRFGCMAIFSALLCDLFLLPALIMIFKPDFQKKTARHSHALTQPEPEAAK